MSIDAIGNFLTIIRNGVMASKAKVSAPYSRINFELGQILVQEGFIRECVVADEENGKKTIQIRLKYVANEAAIHEITRESTPGLRYYTGVRDIRPVIGGLGVSILTTNRGLLTNKKAKELGVGGEVLCTVW